MQRNLHAMSHSILSGRSRPPAVKVLMEAQLHTLRGFVLPALGALTLCMSMTRSYAPIHPRVCAKHAVEHAGSPRGMLYVVCCMFHRAVRHSSLCTSLPVRAHMRAQTHQRTHSLAARAHLQRTALTYVCGYRVRLHVQPALMKECDARFPVHPGKG